MKHYIPISGKDSFKTWLVQVARNPSNEYIPLFNPTGAELPPIFEWLDRVEEYIGVKIVYIGDNLEDIIAEQGILPSIKARFCTRLSKIYPMEDFIGDEPCFVYYGIRADEKRTGYINAKKPNIKPVYPLVEEKIGLDDVYTSLYNIGLLPPAFFWQSLYDRVVQILGDDAARIEQIHPITRQQLFSWRTRMNCSFCFFQRAYEWVGLLEHYPDLFWNAVKIEEETGGIDFTWRYKQSLRVVARKANDIKERRARKVAKFFLPKQGNLFDMLDNGEEGDTPDILTSVSCGLFCGK